MSKIGAEKLKGFIKECLENRKKRKFTETIDIQIGLKDYNTNKDKNYESTIKHPHINIPPHIDHVITEP